MSDKGYECMILDAHLPSGTARFYMPRDFPVCGGMFEIRRIRNVTEEDKATFAGRPDPEDFLA